MKQINDPGNHWHKDCMPYEEPYPGITEPNYDEHADYINEISRAETGDDISKADYIAMDDWDDVPF